MVVIAISLCYYTGLFSFSQTDEQLIALENKHIVARLREVVDEVSNVSNHIEAMNSIIDQGSAKIENNKKIREQLEAIINDKSAEAEHWQALSGENKGLVVEAIAVALKNDAHSSFWKGVFVSFIVNIVATLVWSLIGSPGLASLNNKLGMYTNTINSLMSR